MPLGKNAGNLVSVGVAAGAILSKFLNVRTWTVTNIESRETVQGDFPAEDITRDVETNWAQITTLNRQNPILQFLNGNSETFSVQARFFKQHAADEGVVEKLETLIEWTKRDDNKGRPPIVGFALGDGSAISIQAVLASVTGIKYGVPSSSLTAQLTGFAGQIREVRFQLNFIRHHRFKIDDEQVTDTRYHRTIEGEYYELIAQREYGNALLGDVIRKLPEHANKQLLVPGDVVKLPAVEGVRTTLVAPTSIALQTAYGKKDTPQKALRIATFDRLSTDPNYIFFFGQPPASTVAGPNDIFAGIFDETFDESFE